MRVWIAPWIDAKQDLHMPGYVFTEVTPRRWSFGEAAAVTGKPLVPLQVDMRGPVGEEGEPEIGNEAKMLMPRGLVQGMQQQGGAHGGAGAATSTLMPSTGAR
jgi:conjugal transfer pilus assembly protein TraV